MSVRAMTAVWAIDLPDSQKIVLLALADCANDEGLCWPSMATLSRKCSKGERTVQGVIKDLVSAGHLSRTEVPGKGCKYIVHPRSGCAPAEAAPAQSTAPTPAAAADKPSRTIIQKTEKRAHVLPADWKPSPFGKGTKSRAVVDGWPPGEFEAQLEHFTAHHRGKGNRFTDWQDAWSTWALNSRRFGGNNGRSGLHPANDRTSVRGSRPNPALDMVLEAERELQAEAFSQNPGADWAARPALPPH